MVPRLLGIAGLLPQLAAGYVLLENNPDWHFTALAMAYAYAALILSFLGGLWWGLAAAAARPPAWLWYAAIVPSLIALGSGWPWATGQPWPGPSMVVLGVALMAALGVDWRLQQTGIAPVWWLSLRIPLSLGLGGITLAIGILS
ncbi:DUF3429 family protein [Sphingomonas sp. 28-63-12]|uniref:DUF3429 family protein n=1 Tax=Sphingomonas sp. 28-63-12 TaxID=1970434 RepID=UPI0035A8229A